MLVVDIPPPVMSCHSGEVQLLEHKAKGVLGEVARRLGHLSSIFSRQRDGMQDLESKARCAIGDGVELDAWGPGAPDLYPCLSGLRGPPPTRRGLC